MIPYSAFYDARSADLDEPRANAETISKLHVLSCNCEVEHSDPAVFCLASRSRRLLTERGCRPFPANDLGATR
jgi:hypothetical protein